MNLQPSSNGEHRQGLNLENWGLPPLDMSDVPFSIEDFRKTSEKHAVGRVRFGL